MAGARVSDTQLISSINRIPSLFPGFLHTVIDRSHDLTHSIICHHHFFSAVITFHDFRQTNGTLTGMMGDSIRYTALHHTLLAACSIIAVFPIPGGPISRIGLWRDQGITIISHLHPSPGKREVYCRFLFLLPVCSFFFAPVNYCRQYPLLFYFGDQTFCPGRHQFHFICSVQKYKCCFIIRFLSADRFHPHL